MATDTKDPAVVFSVPSSEDGNDNNRDEDEAEAPHQHHCGIGRFRPRCLQWFASAKFFTFILCVQTLVEGAVSTGFISVVIPSLEKRYKLSSTATSVIASMFDVAIVATVVFVTHFGGRGHKPRWLGLGSVVQAAGVVIFVLPQFVFGSYHAGLPAGIASEYCGEVSESEEPCPEGNTLAYFLLVVGFFIVGAGASPIYTLGPSHIDDIVSPKYVSIHLGVFYTMAILGPAVGYGVGAELLSVYVDPWESTTLSEKDPNWVGAWWISFVGSAGLYLLIAVPFLMFPRLLPDSHLVKSAREDAKMVSIVLSDSSISSASDQSTPAIQPDITDVSTFSHLMKELPKHLNRLVRNLAWVSATGAITTAFLSLTGIAIFAPKYYKSQFRLDESDAGLVAGGIGILTGLTGIITGALLVFCLKSNGKKVALAATIITVTAIFPAFSFIIHCPTTELVGVTAGLDPTHHGLLYSCNEDCHCSNFTSYNPICGADGLTYFSPCHAGCLNESDDDKYTSCRCIAEVSTMSGSNGAVNNTATSGECYDGCSLFPVYLTFSIIFLYILFILKVPVIFVTIRCVPDDLRSLALGVQSLVYRLLGTIPSPILYGVVFDSACLYWNNQCGSRGNCWVYDNRQLSYRLLSLPLGGVAVTAFLSALAWKVYPKQQPLQLQLEERPKA